MAGHDAHLEALSVFEGDLDLGLAAEITGLPGPELLTHLDDAERAGWVVLDGGGIRLDSATRAQVYNCMGLERRARAHAHAAAVLERVRPQDLAGIARQRAGAVAILGAESVLDGIEAAAGAPLRAHDWITAADVLQEAVTLARAAHNPRADELALSRARALYRAGLYGAAMDVCREVARSARRFVDMPLLAESALVVRGIDDRDLCAEMLDALREALPALPDGTPLQARALAQQVMLVAQLSHQAADLAAARAALMIADDCGDPRAIVECLHAMQMAHAGPGRVRERLELADRLESLAVEAGLEEYLRWPLSWRLDALWQLGRRPALDDAIARLEEHGQARNDGLATWKARNARAALAQVEGRFADAFRLADEALELAERGGHQMGMFVHRIQRSYLASLTALGEAGDFRVADYPQGSEAMAVYPAMEAAIRGELEKAAILFERGWAARDQVFEHDLAVPTYWALAVTAYELARTDVAEELYRLLEPYAEQVAVAASGQAASPGSVSLYLGELAALAAHWERMEADFARALRRNIEFGDRPAAALTRYGWARGMLRRGHVHDRERALPLLDAAEREATELGMRPLMRSIASLRARLIAGQAHPLSARELEVAILVSGGLTNRAVADRLHLSVRTVENHVLNCMNKLGLDNRAQVAAWVTRARAAGDLP
ncbi:MAG: LuxR C-terminal-related transcriptional regulator [Candidatus Dormibacteria bacterium]